MGGGVVGVPAGVFLHVVKASEWCSMPSSTHTDPIDATAFFNRWVAPVLRLYRKEFSEDMDASRHRRYQKSAIGTHDSRSRCRHVKARWHASKEPLAHRSTHGEKMQRKISELSLTLKMFPP